MENIGSLINQNQISEHSNNLPTTSRANTALREITREEEVGLFSIINQARALQGWTLAPAHELAPICKVWWKEFSRYKIHPKHYETLFQRAHDARIQSIKAGARNIPSIDATLLICQWTGEAGLAAELRQKDIDSHRYLPSTAVSDCELCFGSGIEVVPGKGARNCTHGNE